MADEYQHRRLWFEKYTARVEAGVFAPAKPGLRYRCPCCGYPMLSGRGRYEICCLCNWEDDGQDDPHAAEVWGGPNGSYSLAQARDNFRRYGVMYDPTLPDTRIGSRDSAVELDAKRQIVAAFDAMPDSRDESEVARLWATIIAAESVLAAEIHRKIREDEARNG